MNLHDSRCATRKGYPCNCALAAFNRKPTEIEQYMAAMTLQQSQDHNNAHEALLMNGYDWKFVPCDFEDDGDGESGPHLTGHPAWLEYTGPDEYVITQNGAVVHREKRDHAAEAFYAEQEQAFEQPKPKRKRSRRRECTCADDDHCDVHPMDTPSLDPNGPWGPP